MALPFLPHDQIALVFNQLKVEATTAPLQQFMTYVQDTWVDKCLATILWEGKQKLCVPTMMYKAGVIV